MEGTDIRFSRPDAPQGLSTTKLGPIVQDNQGFLWFGSQHGLYRFDGYSFKAFVHDPANPTSLSGAFVNTLFKDRNGTLWVGCGQFLDRMDMETATFTHHPVSFVLHISQDNAGLLWLSTPSGLYELDPATGRSRRYVHDPADSSSLSSSNIRATGEDREGRFWVSNRAGMDEFDRSSGKVLLRIPLRETVRHTFAFYEDHLGSFWIYRGSGNPLSIFDPKSNTLTKFCFSEDTRSGSIPTTVTAMLEDHNGTLWLGTIDAGLLKLDREHKRFIRYRHHITDNDSIGENSIGDLALDREGLLWIALGGMGLTSFSLSPMPFKRYRHDFGDPNLEGEPFVGAVFEDENGTLWIGSHEALNRIDDRARRYAAYHLGSPGEDSDAIAISEDRSGYLWIGTYSHGLVRFDRKTGRFTRYRHDPADRYSLSDDIVPRLLVDRHGTLWAATDNGLDRFDAVRERFTTYRMSHQQRDHYLDLIEDRHGVFWLGTDSSGLERFDPATGQFTAYEHEENRLRSLSDNRVNSVHIDKAGTLWVGTQDGLDEFEPNTGQFTTYNRREGLPGSAVGCVLEDEQGHLWMSTNNGVTTFDTKRKSFKSYSIADGLPGVDLTGWGACFKSPSGEMFFGGFAGATSFFPDKVQEELYAPSIVLTDFRVSGASIAAGENSILKRTINYTDSIRLTSKQNVFSIGFTALSYANPATNRYRYKLEGLDKQWNEVSSDERSASYTTLPAGVYEFRVEGAKTRGPWTEPGRKLTIEILPAWWLTTWFRLLCLAAFAGLLWALYQWRVHQMQRQFAIGLEARVHERTRIARELHDSLLQGFQGLMFRLQAVRHLLPGRPAEAIQALDVALERADQAITEGRDTVSDLRESIVGDSDIAQALTLLSEELALQSDNGTVPCVRVIVEGKRRELDPLSRDEIYRIAREALRNAFRHAQAQKIEAEVTYRDFEFLLHVRDDGSGFDPTVAKLGVRAGHWGLPGMRERAEKFGGRLEVWSEQGAGTEVELSVPASIAYARSEARRRFWFLGKKAEEINGQQP